MKRKMRGQGKFLSDLKDLATNTLTYRLITLDSEEIRRLNKKVMSMPFFCSLSRARRSWEDWQKNLMRLLCLIKNNRVRPIRSNHADRCVESYFYDLLLKIMVAF